MRALSLAKQGLDNALKIVNIPIPKVGKRQVLVKNSYAGLNFIDTYQASGLYKMETPFTLGVEGIGTIEDIGEEVDIQSFGLDLSDDLIGRKVVYLVIFFPI